MKKYTSAPLPFQGQKRNFISKLKEVLKTFPDDAVFVDLFGGSGLLSHTVKSEKPNATVIYNDFDNYINRLQNIPKTNALLDKLRDVLSDVENKQKVPDHLKQKVLKIIKSEEKNNFVDYITLSGSLLFSGNSASNFETFQKQTFYKRIPKSNYASDGYLKNVIRESQDYRLLFQKYENQSNVIFLVDPPYLSTDAGTYKEGVYWKLSDHLDILTNLENQNFVYFTSNKSHIFELCNWIGNYSGKNPFANTTTTTITTTNQVTFQSQYTDIMIVKNTDKNGH